MSTNCLLAKLASEGRENNWNKTNGLHLKMAKISSFIQYFIAFSLSHILSVYDKHLRRFMMGRN